MPIRDSSTLLKGLLILRSLQLHSYIYSAELIVVRSEELCIGRPLVCSAELYIARSVETRIVHSAESRTVRSAELRIVCSAELRIVCSAEGQGVGENVFYLH